MDLTGSLHDLHTTYDGSLQNVPGGPVGQLLFGVLYIPSALIRTLEFVAANFGSELTEHWDY